jgi:hypothetical protein
MLFRRLLFGAASKRTRGRCNIDGEANLPPERPTRPRQPWRSLPRGTCLVGTIADRRAEFAHLSTTRSGWQRSGRVSPAPMECLHRMLPPPAPPSSRK